MVALDLFAGCGGMSLGLEYAGIDVVAGIEWAIPAFVTYATNLGSARGGAVTYSTGKREELQRRIAALAAERDAYIEAEVEAAGGAASSLDQQIYDAVRSQAAPLGLDYEGGPRF